MLFRSAGHTEPLGMAQGVLKLNERSLAFDVVFFDNEVQISCVEADLTTRLPGCMTSGSTSVGAPNFIYVKLVNFNAKREDVASKVVATFGGQPASGLVGFGGDVGTKTLILRLDAPRLSSDYLEFSNGKASVELQIGLVTGQGGFVFVTVNVFQPPTISTARFDSTGTQIDVTFDQTTNTPPFAEGSCCSVLDFSCQSSSVGLVAPGLGEGAECMWKMDNMTVIVTLGPGATVQPGDPVKVRGPVKSANGVSFSADTTVSVVLDKPSKVLAPAPAVLSGPEVVDPCAAVELVFDVPSSRALTYYWSSPDNSALNAQLMTATTGKVRLEENTPSLTSAQPSTVHVYAVDFLGAVSATRALTLTKLAKPAPGISFVGQPSYTASGEILLQGKPSFSTCAGAGKAQLEYSWSSEQSALAAALQKTSANIPELWFPPKTLAAGKYTVKLQVSMAGDASQQSFKTFELDIRASPLQARLSGPSNVFSGAGFTLDARQSYDPDVKLAKGGVDANLMFAWQCATVNLDDPDEALGLCLNQATGAELILTSSATPQITSGQLSASKLTYRFTVTVSKTGRPGVSASLDVRVVSEPIPTVSISAGGAGMQTDPATGMPKVNADGRLWFTGTAATGVAYKWEILRGMAPASIPAEAFAVGDTSADFVVRPLTSGEEIFTKNAVYTIKLTGSKDGYSGVAQIDALINAPPSMGTCTACNTRQPASCQTSGSVLEDFFLISCQTWADADLPLSYAYGFTSNGKPMELAPVADSSRTMLLGFGCTKMTARVIDALGASSATIEMPKIGRASCRERV